MFEMCRAFRARLIDQATNKQKSSTHQCPERQDNGLPPVEHQQLERVPLPVKHAMERGHVADRDKPKQPECADEARCRSLSTTSAMELSAAVPLDFCLEQQPRDCVLDSLLVTGN